LGGRRGNSIVRASFLRVQIALKALLFGSQQSLIT